MRRGLFRQGGRPHQFVVLADVSRALREEERLAWQRLIRVLGHEINNSLTPINSLADRLNTLLQRSPPEGELRDDLQRGLGVIANRSEGLTRFLASYTKLAKLPPPTFASVDVGGVGAARDAARVAAPGGDRAEPGRDAAARTATSSTSC